MGIAQAIDWKSRLKASGVHLGISLLIAALAALLVFVFWFPYPYRDSSGGSELFLLVTSVDVVLGPLITLAVFNRNKRRAELVKDLTVVGLVQLVALSYGLWTVCMARPVHLVFEFDRFRVVHAVEVPPEMHGKAPTGVREMPLTGPTVLAVRPFKDAKEESDATILALTGVSLSSRPDLWQAYPQAHDRVLAAAKPLADLRKRFPNDTAVIDAAVAKTGQPESTLRWLPMVERKSFWTVLLDASSADVRGFVPLDSF